MICPKSVVSSFLKDSRKTLDPEYKRIDRTEPVKDTSKATIILEIPIIRQSTGHSCGAASLLSVLGYYGYNPREDQLTELLKMTESGIDPEDFIGAVREFGLKIKIERNLSFQDVRNYLNDKIPVILNIQAWGDKEDYSDVWSDGHYVVAAGYDKDGFFLMDPSRIGFSYLSSEELKERWHDIKKDRSKKDIHIGIVIYGKKSKFDYSKVKPIE